ncbi:hypothetical protein OJF2_69790 [Aquisphaera giovannonii]|uniref:Uncharacterized protein n=1 Tax=Aquisphaera giovannonii TaxID=406548 RepID=A0A5B9WCH5_9BACT|nr:hypothetical protein [Aquisphaera giovannonii]QEH38378.1 hypothetical protein OJF2_69790 [Aquisphaera giovannonii]
MRHRRMRPRTNRRPRVRADLELLEGRALLSYLVVEKGGRVVPVHVSDARRGQPLYSNGLAVKKAPQFYSAYTGPRLPSLNGVRATGYVQGTSLILSGTVAGSIAAHPTQASEQATYTFGIDRGGSSKTGPFPGRPHIRFDSVVVAQVTTKGIAAYVQINDPRTNQPGTTPKALPSSAVTVSGDEIAVKVPLSMLPSSGHAMNQWNVNFFTRNPNQKATFRGIASFTPEFTSFQIYVKPPFPA